MLSLRLFEKKVMRRIFRNKREEVKADWRKLHNEELHNLYSSQNIIRVSKFRKMRWAENVAGMADLINAQKIWRKETTWQS
jgi:hypothetical protein